MAGFKGHITFGVLTAVAYTGLLFTFTHTPLFTLKLAFVATAFTSILPDIDSNSGFAIQIVFALLALFAMAATFDLLVQQKGFTSYSLLVSVGTGLTIFTIAQGVFKKATHHRGAFHSIPMAFIFGLVCLSLLSYFPMSTYSQATISFGVTLGYLSHLTLDELNSLATLSSLRLKPKRSFGTALKLTSCSSLATATMYVSLCYLISLHKLLILYLIQQLLF